MPRIPKVLHPVLRVAFSELNRAGVTWCLMRPHSLADASSRGDVDLLVARGDQTRATAVLADVGFVMVPVWGRGSHSFHVLYDAATACWIVVDMVSDLAFGPLHEFPSGAEEDCLARRHRLGEAFVFASDDSFWTLLLHCLLDKGSISPVHAHELARLAGRAQLDSRLARTVTDVCPPGWDAGRLVEDVRIQDWDAVLRVAPQLSKGWMKREGWQARRRTLRNRFRRLVARALLRHRRSMSLVLLSREGVDASSLVSQLDDSWPFPVRSLCRGFKGDGGWVDGEASEGTRWRLSCLMTTPRLVVGVLLHMARGGLVVLDGNTCEPLFGAPRPKAVGQRRCGGVVARACLRRGLTILLYRGATPGDDDRSPGSPDGERRLSWLTPRAETIDASRGVAEVRREVVNLLWLSLSRRLSGRTR